MNNTTSKGTSGVRTKTTTTYTYDDQGRVIEERVMSYEDTTTAMSEERPRQQTELTFVDDSGRVHDLTMGLPEAVERSGDDDTVVAEGLVPVENGAGEWVLFHVVNPVEPGKALPGIFLEITYEKGDPRELFDKITAAALSKL